MWVGASRSRQSSAAARLRPSGPIRRRVAYATRNRENLVTDALLPESGSLPFWPPIGFDVASPLDTTIARDREPWPCASTRRPGKALHG